MARYSVKLSSCINIIGRTKRKAIAAFRAIEHKSTDSNLAVNDGQTKYMLLINKDTNRKRFQITVNSYTVDV